MWLTSLFRRPKTYRNAGRVGQIGHPSHRRRSFAPHLEILEDRTLPSTLTVLNNLDSGAGSLRASITNAKSGDTIVFALSLDGQTITLTSDQITISKSLDIEGPGASLLGISGNDTFRVFDITNGNAVVSIAGLTISHGQTQLGSGGGGILNEGSTLTLANDVFSYNQVVSGRGSFGASGGAINNGGGPLTVTDSSFIGNQAIGTPGAYGGNGGAVFNHSVAATFIRCTFMGNHAVGGDGGKTNSPDLGFGGGGAIWNGNGSDPNSVVTVQQSTFTGNQARGGNGGISTGSKGFIGLGSGGAIVNFGNSTLTVDTSTFISNQAIGGSNTSGTGYALGSASGGCIQNEGTASITNSRFDENEALAGSFNTVSGSTIVGRAVGGAINNRPLNGGVGTVTASGDSFTNNSAVGGLGNVGGLYTGQGWGGALNNLQGGTMAISVSTFSGNQAIGGQGGTDQGGADALGGAIANVLGSTLTVSSCMFTGNQATGGADGSGANGGNGFGGGLYNDGTSSLTVGGSTITSNSAVGGAAGSGGSAGQGIGGGVYSATGGSVCLDQYTVSNIDGNTASTSDNDIFGIFTIC